jgi:hypothetical protein
MNLPKYTVCKVIGKNEWTVSKKGKVLFTTSDKNDAFDHVQRLVEDDVWNAANRD